MADNANPQVTVTLTAEDAGLSSALKSLSDELKRLDSQQVQSASTAARAARTMAEGTGSIRTQIGLLDNTIRGAHAQAMADLIRRFSDSAVVMNLLPTAATGGAFVLLGGIVLDVVRKIEAMKNAGAEARQAFDQFQNASRDSMRRFEDKVTETDVKVDELAGDHLKAVRDELVLIDHQTLEDLETQFDALSRKADELFDKLGGGWFGAVSAVKEKMTAFEVQQGSLLSRGLRSTAEAQAQAALKQWKLVLDQAQEYETLLSKIGAPGAARADQLRFMQLSKALAGEGFSSQGTTIDTNTLYAIQSAVTYLQDVVNSFSDAAKLAQNRRTIFESEESRKKGFGAGDAALAQREEYRQYARRIEDAKRAMQGLLEIENTLTHAESEGARGTLNERAAGLRSQSTLDQQAVQELNAAKAQTLRLDEQIAEQSGDDKKRQQLEIAQEQIQLSRVQEELTKANLLGQTELAAALTREAQSWETLIQAQQRALQVNHAIASMESAMNTLFDAAMKGSGGVKQAFVGMEESIVTSLERSLAAMVLNAAQQKALLEGTKLASAAASARDAFRSAMQALPFPINLPVAAGWAAAAFAASMAFAQGGLVRGPGGPTGDRVPAMLSDGEFVMRASAVRQIGVPNLAALNAGAVEPAGVHVHMHPQVEINLFHHGDDAKTVIERDLAPAIKDLFRRGALSAP